MIERGRLIRIAIVASLPVAVVAAVLLVESMAGRGGADARDRPPRSASGSPPGEASVSANAPARSDREERGLRGEVSQLTTRLFLPPQAYGSDPADRGAWTLWSYSIASYGRDGFLSEERSFDAQNRLTGLSIRERDRDGVPVGLAARAADGTLDARCDYRYDGEGRLAREEWHDGSGSLTGRIDYEYDPRGRLARRLSEARYSDGSASRMETVYTHDARWRLVAEDHIDPRYEGVALRLEHAYDDERRTRTLHLQRGAWLEGIVFYSYDERGNLALESSYQIPEGVDDAPFRTASSPADIPIAYVSSETRYEYRYYGER